jgi:hypothetical protein
MMLNVPKPVNGNRPVTAIACVAIVTVLITGACKKKTDSSVSDRLMHKWSLVQILDTVYSSTASPVPGKYEGKADEYMDFSTAGRLYSFIDKRYDTANYTYSEQNFKINAGGYKYNILILTDQTMILYEPRYSPTSSANDYTAYKITLKR